jgi:hypothetical protein
VKDTGLETLVAACTDIPERLEFYCGTEVLFYNHRLHAYYQEVDGQRVLVPGSTTVCATIDKSQPLMWWASDQNSLYVIDNIPASDEARKQLAAMYSLLKAKESIDALEPISLPTITTSDLAVLLKQGRAAFDAVRKEAADIGSVAHDFLEGFVNAKIDGTTYDRPKPIDDPTVVEKFGEAGAQRATNCVNAALDWFDKHHVTFIFAERKIYSREYRYSGTADWFAFVTSCGDSACCPFEGTVFTCGDFKTSKALHEDYYVQLASYQHAWNEEMPTGDPAHTVTQRLLLRIDKEGDGFEVKIRPLDTFEADFDAFLGALAIYGWVKQLELDRKYEKAVIKAEKAAAKAVEKASKPKRKPRKIVIKEVEPIATASIPVEPLPWEGEPRFKTPQPPCPEYDFDAIPIERPM